MASIIINIVGQWRLYLGETKIELEVESLDEIRDYVEGRFGPDCKERLRLKGIKGNTSIWDNSNILINKRNIRKLKKPILKDGDVIELLPKIAGG